MTIAITALRRAAAVLTGLMFMYLPAGAFEIKPVTSPGGIKAWLVEDHTIPLVNMNFSFRGGSAADPKGKEGLAYFLSGMLDEGAGPYDSESFKLRVQDLGMRLSYGAGPDYFSGSFGALSQNTDASFEMLRLSLNETRFDPEPLTRVRGQIMLNISAQDQDPNSLLDRAAKRRAFGDHPYANQSSGTAASLARITADDLAGLKGRLFARSNLLVAVVGDIDAQKLGVLLDQIFGKLPATDSMPAISDVMVKTGPSVQVVDFDVPQSSVQLLLPGIKRDDPDFIPAFVMNSIFGGSSFGARLVTEVREKRGLSYHVGSGLDAMEHSATFVIGGATRNEKVGEMIDVLKAEMKKMADEGPTAEELAAIKTYLTGSYPLRFDSGGAISGQLLGIQQQKLGIDYVERRNSLIEAVTLEDTKRVAKRLLTGDPLITIAGRPAGIKTNMPPG